MNPRTSIPSVITASALFIGCGGNVSRESSSSSTSSGASSSSSSGGAGGDVTGTIVYRFLLADGSSVTQPVDPSGTSIAALVQQGTGWTTYPGTVQADGSFTIPDVPQGPYVLASAPIYLYTSARVVELGQDVLGRPDAVYSASPSTAFAGNIQGLDAWAEFDRVEWLSFNAGGETQGFQGAIPAVGATSLHGEPSSWYGGLVDGSRGDVLYVTQLEQMQAAGVLYGIITRLASFPNVEQQDGVVTTVSGTFAPVAAGESVSLDFRESQFAALAPEVNPTAMDYSGYLNLATLPGAATDGLFSSYADLLTFYVVSADLKTGPLTYANPFPASWGESLLAEELVVVPYSVPGATSPTYSVGTISVTVPISQAAAGPIQPVVSPVQEPEVQGQSAFGTLSGISLTPTLTWKAPAVGTPSGYEVLVYEIQVTLGSAVSRLGAILSTTDTSMTLPPGVLAQGSTYYFQITALVKSGDFASHPFAPSPTLASADVLTSAATP